MEPAASTDQIRRWNNELLPYHLQYWLTAASSIDTPRFVYIDGFAGPGVLSDNKDGAPAIAYKTALKYQRLSLNCPEINIVLVEADKKNCESLLHVLQQIKEKNRGSRNGKYNFTYKKIFCIEG